MNGTDTLHRQRQPRQAPATTTTVIAPAAPTLRELEQGGKIGHAMPKIKYEDRRFCEKSRKRLARINAHLDAMVAGGYESTSVRHLFYALIGQSENVEGENDYITTNPSGYRMVQTLVNEGREAGEIDWSQIEDRHREFIFPPGWGSIADYIEPDGYHPLPWLTQPRFIVLIIEKATFEEVAARISDEFRIRISSRTATAARPSPRRPATSISATIPASAPCSIWATTTRAVFKWVESSKRSSKSTPSARLIFDASLSPGARPAGSRNPST